MFLNAIQFALFSWLKIDLSQTRFSHLDLAQIDQLLQLTEQLSRSAAHSNVAALAPLTDSGTALPNVVNAAIAAILHRSAGPKIAHVLQVHHDAHIAAGIAAAAIGWRDYERALVSVVGEQKDAIVEDLAVRLALLRARAISEGALALCLYTANLSDQAPNADHNTSKLSCLLAPIVQFWPAKYALATTDFATPLSISVRPAQDLLASIFADGGAVLLLLLQRIAATAQAAAKQPKLAKFAPNALEYGTELAQAALKLGAQFNAGQRQTALANASIFLDALAWVVVCWLSLDQANAAIGTAEFDRLNANCRYLDGYELTKVRAAIVVLTTPEMLSGECGF